MILSYILWLATDIYTTVYGIRYINTDISLVYISVTNNKCDRTAGGELVWRGVVVNKPRPQPFNVATSKPHAVRFGALDTSALARYSGSLYVPIRACDSQPHHTDSHDNVIGSRGHK